MPCGFQNVRPSPATTSIVTNSQGVATFHLFGFRVEGALTTTASYLTSSVTLHEKAVFICRPAQIAQHLC
jgi:hypothetical protein